MGLFDDLFKKQPGGSTAGNVLRDVVKQLTNGAFGTGANKPTQKDADRSTLSDAEFQLKYNETKGGASVPAPSLGSVVGSIGAGVQSATVLSLAKRYWYIILIPVVLFVALGYFIIKSRQVKPAYRKQW